MEAATPTLWDADPCHTDQWLTYSFMKLTVLNPF